MRHTLLLGCAALAASTIVTACGSSGDDSTFDPNNGQGGSAASGGSANGGSAGSNGGTGGLIVGDSGGGNGGTGGDVSPDAACATGQAEAKLQPVSLFIMLDTSSSMNDNQKWTNAKQGITSFVSSTAAAGLKVALAYFPDAWDEDAGTTTCDGTAYTVDKVVAPNMVAMGVLPANRNPIVNSINAKQTTSDGTPTEDALNGIKRFCTQYNAQHAGERCVGVLVTDGEPNGCNGDIGFLANVAKSAFVSNPSVPTYVLGMTGAIVANLNQIADGGGTKQAFDVKEGNANLFLNALNAIRGQIMSCDFPVPTGANADPTRVNIKLTTKAGAISLGKVANAAACVAKAWYYNNEAAPTRIYLCPETCTTARADATSRIDVILGCKSEPPGGAD